jgi:hypothetical protein
VGEELPVLVLRRRGHHAGPHLLPDLQWPRPGVQRPLSLRQELLWRLLPVPGTSAPSDTPSTPASQDDCTNDNDCGGHGRCWDIGATSWPQKQCYCEAGYFGPGCNVKAHTKSQQLQDGLYTKRRLSEKLELYWRILKEDQQIEMVLRLNGTSWAAVGWRPQGLTASCKKFPVLADQPDPVARSIDFGEPAAEPEPAAQVQPRSGRAKKLNKRMTSLDVSISNRMFSVSSSSSSRRRRRETKEEVKRRLRRRFQQAFARPDRGDAASRESEVWRRGASGLAAAWGLGRIRGSSHAGAIPRPRAAVARRGRAVLCLARGADC